MAGRKLLELDEQNFRAEVDGGLPVLVDFWAAWCAPCRMIAPALEAIAEKYEGKVRIAKVDVDAQPALAEQFQVVSLPTLLLIRRAEVIGQIIGAVPKSRIEALLDAELSRAIA
jgi:thioredoxin 1